MSGPNEGLRVIFDDVGGLDMAQAMLSGEVLAAVSSLEGATDPIAELAATDVLLALLKRLTKPKRNVILQNRDRSTPAMIAQMTAIAGAPDYYRVAPTKEFASGAPIVFGDDDVMPANIAMGRKDKAVAADGQRFAVQYAVVDASDLLTSNAADGTANADYEAGQSGKLRAIAGNGRIAGLIAGYARGTAADYVQELTEDETTGIAADVIGTFTSPILVRIMRAEDVTENIGDISNQRGTSDLSPVEAAQNDAKRLDLSQLDVSDDGKPTETAALDFIAAMPESERNNLMDGKQPGQKAYDRLMAAVFWKAYGDPELVRLYAQSTDPEVKTILGGMAAAAGDLAKLDGAGDLDFRNVVTDAAGLAVNAKRRGVKLADFARQIDMTLSPDTMSVVRLFADNIRSARKIGEGLRSAARFAYEEFTKDAEDMFGPVEKATREQVLARLEYKPAGESMFDSIDPMRAIELSGSLVEKTEALQALGVDDPLTALTLSGEIIAIISELEYVPPAEAPAAVGPDVPPLVVIEDPLPAAAADTLVVSTPEPTTAPSEPVDMETYIKIAANSIGELRRVDGYRVLNSVASDNIDGVTRSMLADYIVANRPDLAAEVATVMGEEWPGEEWVAKSPAVDPVVSIAQPLPEEGAAIPPSAGEPDPIDRSKLDSDLAYLADVAAEKVDMWADEVPDRIEAIILAYQGDAAVEVAGRAAVAAYTDFMSAAITK